MAPAPDARWASAMLFNSTEFIQFFAAFALLYHLARRSLAWRNRLIVVASYFFYGWWDWRFLGLLVFSSLVDFGVALALGNTSEPRQRRRWLLLSLAVNLGTLGFFKYFGFFLSSFLELLASLGVDHPSWTWNVILPVGISFYTFQTLSYTLDVYSRRLSPTCDLTAFLAYVSFFPQLVAGPIERASHLLPQFSQTRTLTADGLAEGLWLILAGLFKKVVIADHLGAFADLAFNRSVGSAPVVLLGVLAFAGQIYGDFSGYSDVARGLGCLLGFDLRRNFYLPYAAPSIREFWRRWHISLSTWLRDYLYLPLGGSRRGPWRTALNLMLTMLLGGLWHGAAWNFVLWGAWHGIALIAYRAWHSSRTPAVAPWLGWFITMVVVGYGWLLFRATSLDHLADLHRALFEFSAPDWLPDFALGVLGWWAPLAAFQWWQWRAREPLAPLQAPAWIRLPLCGVALLAVHGYWQPQAVPFIYFQF